MSEENTGDKNSVVFYTNSKCPYAQRVWIVLEEKEVQYRSVEVALYGSGGKPSWFMALNPKGEVPVLKHGETVVVDSNQIIRQLPQAAIAHSPGMHAAHLCKETPIPNPHALGLSSPSRYIDDNFGVPGSLQPADGCLPLLPRYCSASHQ